MATPVKWGAAPLVNSTTSGPQTFSSMATFDTCGYVIAWADWGENARDTASPAVRGQILGADGAKLGPEIRVNTKTADTQHDPDVATLAEGRFVAVWTDSAGDGADSGVHAQIFTSSGAKSGAAFTVATTTTSTQGEPTVAGLAVGRIVVSWTDFSATGADTSSAAIRSRPQPDLRPPPDRCPTVGQPCGRSPYRHRFCRPDGRGPRRRPPDRGGGQGQVVGRRWGRHPVGRRRGCCREMLTASVWPTGRWCYHPNPPSPPRIRFSDTACIPRVGFNPTLPGPRFALATSGKSGGQAAAPIPVSTCLSMRNAWPLARFWRKRAQILSGGPALPDQIITGTVTTQIDGAGGTASSRRDVNT